MKIMNKQGILPIIRIPYLSEKLQKQKFLKRWNKLCRYPTPNSKRGRLNKNRK